MNVSELRFELLKEKLNEVLNNNIDDISSRFVQRLMDRGLELYSAKQWFIY